MRARRRESEGEKLKKGGEGGGERVIELKTWQRLIDSEKKSIIIILT